MEYTIYKIAYNFVFDSIVQHDKILNHNVIYHGSYIWCVSDIEKVQDIPVPFLPF